ncbi:peptidase S54, rhomboid [Artemisia annua]|uniref:RHOMBOID-like protein n=1 Tax=Artemisia annua TaxID=35608 RepID=A0A2U1LGB2_ARTAN|nr:peptidase S54, rhomboid [Artemisia annua]
MGALDVSKVVDHHQGRRLITCIWLHSGLFHLFASMLSLLVIGIRLEQEFGFIRIELIYIISGFGGSILSALFLQSNISVGTSGAMAALSTLVIIIVINLVVGILPHVDNFAHLGGFSSWVCVLDVSSVSLDGLTKDTLRLMQGVMPSLNTRRISAMVAGLVSLLCGTNLNDHCSWCHYMSCVPTSRWSCDTDPVSCMSEQTGNQYTLTCSDSGKNGTYLLTNPNTSQLRGLCTQLCRSLAVVQFLHLFTYNYNPKVTLIKI